MVMYIRKYNYTPISNIDAIKKLNLQTPLH